MVSVEKTKSLGIKTGNICPVCKQDLVLITSFNKPTCKYCYLLKEHKQGHSGMLKLSENSMDMQLFMKRLFCTPENSIKLIRVPKGNKAFASLYLSHYPQSKGIVGRSFNYLILNEGFITGIIGACSPPITVSEVDRFFYINSENRIEKINSILNNNIFRLIDSAKPVANLGTRVLKRFRTQLQSDYYLRYKTKLKGLITFVEPPRTGTVYMADNWSYLGKTKGYNVTKRGKMTDYKKYSEISEGQQKLIFGYKFNNSYDW
jgi:hypothetical protein